MDLSAVSSILDDALAPMCLTLWANDYAVRTQLCPLPGDTIGRCTRETPYRRALIEIDPAGHDDRAAVLNTIRHEVLHLTIGEFDVYANVAEAFVPNGAADDAVQSAWTLAVERTISRLESILDSVGWTPEALAGRDTTCSACSKTWRAIAAEGTERVECPRCGEYVTHGRTPAAAVQPPFRLIQFAAADVPGKEERWVLFDCTSARVLGASGSHFGHVPDRIEDLEAEQPEPLACALTQVKNPLGGWTLLNTTNGHILGNGEARFAGVSVRA